MVLSRSFSNDLIVLQGSPVPYIYYHLLFVVSPNETISREVTSKKNYKRRNCEIPKMWCKSMKEIMKNTDHRSFESFIHIFLKKWLTLII